MTTRKLIQEFLDNYKAVAGWDTMRTERTQSILPFVLENIEGDILEIGAHEGRCTEIFCSIGKQYNRKVYVIDPWDGRQQGNNGTFQTFKRKTAQFDNLVVHHTGSENLEIRKLFMEQDLKFAFILIDGLHTYNAVKNDITQYVDLLNVGGILCIDDWRGPYAFSAQIQQATRDNLDTNYEEISTPDSFIESYFVRR